MIDATRKLRRPCLLLGALIGVIVMAGCGTSGVRVSEGTYRALVPTQEQLDSDQASELPGGFRLLGGSGVNTLELQVGGSDVILRIDGTEVAVWAITDRTEVRDAEGSGPFKGAKEVLVLGGSRLVVGELVIEEPVIWPGSFEASPVVTLKQWDSDDRGPAVTCRPDENCLLFSADVASTGTYQDANNPALDQNPIAEIEITEEAVEFVLHSGDQYSINVGLRSLTRGCGISETSLWDVPAEIGLPMADPVLVHTECPTAPGEAIALTIMERDALPLLTSLSPTSGGEWCNASAQCLWFAPV